MQKGVVISILVVAVLVIAAVFFFSGYGKSNSDSQPADNHSSSSASLSLGVNSNPENISSTVSVAISNFAFSQAALKIKAGTTVIWTNEDNVGHTVTSDSGNELSSGTISPGGTYEHTFSNPGTYNYHCSFHSGMKSTVIVQ